MTRPRRTRLNEPTAEKAVDVVPDRNQAGDEDLVRRTREERDYTPRTYDQPWRDDPDVPPHDDET